MVPGRFACLGGRVARLGTEIRLRSWTAAMILPGCGNQLGLRPPSRIQELPASLFGDSILRGSDLIIDSNDLDG